MPEMHKVSPANNNSTKEASVLQDSILLRGTQDHTLGMAVAPLPQTV